MWMPTTSPITTEERFLLPSEPDELDGLQYMHSKCTGERFTRGGLTNATAHLEPEHGRLAFGRAELGR